MADKSNDPVAMWQNMLGEMEKGFNSFAGKAMESPEFSKVVNQVGGVTAGAQKQLGDLMEKYLVGMNLPSRAQMVSMAERLQSIEGQLNEAVPFTFRLKFPANYQIPAHWHPAIEHVTVISGTFNMGTGDKLDRSKTKALSAGSVAIMQPKTNHFAWAKEETIVQVHGVGPWAINYVNPVDDPRKK